MTVDAFASKYGWTPEQIDAQPQELIERMPMVWKAQAGARKGGQLAQQATAKAYAQIAPKRR